MHVVHSDDASLGEQKAQHRIVCRALVEKLIVLLHSALNLKENALFRFPTVFSQSFLTDKTHFFRLEIGANFKNEIHSKFYFSKHEKTTLLKGIENKCLP